MKSDIESNPTSEFRKSGNVLSSNLRRIASLFIPSFLQQRQKPQAKLHSTSWLDGLRGFACFIVFIYHYLAPFHIRHSYGYGKLGLEYGVENPEKAENLNLIQLPIIRSIYSGSAMVSVFFVISGYALSYNLVGLLRNRKWASLFAKLTSSAFRRPIRLLGPPVVSSFIKMLMVYLGLYEFGRPLSESEKMIHKPSFAHRMLLFQQFLSWWETLPDMVDFISVPKELFWPLYAPQAWTIPREVKYSFVLYILVLALSRAKTSTRILTLVVISFWNLRTGFWEMFCFTWGMILAELDHIRQENQTENLTEAPKTTKASRGSGYKWLVLFFISLYLIGAPEKQADSTPGYILLGKLNLLNSIVAGFRFWHMIGSVLLVWTIGNSPSLQRVFTNEFAQYLGQISFALYLVHAFMLDTLGYVLLEFMWSFPGLEGTELAWFISFAILVPVTICVADVFWRLVDLKFLALSRWIENKFCVT